MTKKDFILVASAIEHEISGYREVLKVGNGLNEIGALQCLAEELCERFLGENSRFDKGRFLIACGLSATCASGHVQDAYGRCDCTNADSK